MRDEDQLICPVYSCLCLFGEPFMPSELANTSLATAFNMGNVSGNITWNWNSSIDGVDPNQYYRFSLSNSSSLNLSMSGLQANANLDLLNNSGGLIASSANSGVLAESLNRQLTAGTYYIRVSSIGGANTSYKLGLQGSGAGVDPGSNISSALDFGSFTTNTSRSWGESVSTSDTLDIYRVNLVQYSNLSLSLNNLSANADLQLLDSAGALLASSTNTGTASESMVRALNAGTYFVRVNSVNSNTPYTLSTATSFINAAPTSLQFNLNKTSFSNTETLTISSGQVWDNNGTTDLTRIDFRLLRPDNTWVDVNDALNFTPSGTDTRSAGFNYSLNLSGYGSGNYILQAIAYDKAGAASNVVSKNFIVQAPNQAPNSLQFGLNKTTFLNTETLSINNGWVFDGNGASTLSRVDFRLMQPNGTWIDISDANSFTPWTGNQNWGAFNYSLNLGSYAAGNYALSAIAYDKSGAISNRVSQSFVVQIPVINDWFSLNLKDKELIDLTRNLAKDGELSRTDMIAIFRNAEDGNIIDATEVIDLRLVLSDRGYMMPDYVKNLTGKIVNSDPANAPSGIGNLKAGSSSTHMENLIGKWFLGNDRPDAISYNRTTTHTYQSVSGSLFQGGISYIDVDQNDVGDCYYLAALGSVARQSTSTIQNMFVSQNDDNGDGITDSWTVRLFNNGVADYVTVDRFLPTSVGGGAVFAGWGGGTFNNANNELWVALAEKAYAQFNESGWIGQDNTNSYNGTTTSPTAVIRNAAGINGGHPTTTLRQITGLNTSWFGLVNSVVDMISAFNAGKMVTLCTPDLTGSGIVNNHCYSLIGYNATTDQFRVYNPWGYNNDSQAERWISRQQLLDNFNEWAAIS